MKRKPKYQIMPDGTKIPLPYVGPQVLALVLVQLAVENHIELVPIGHKRSAEMIAIAKRKYRKGYPLETIPKENLRQLSIYSRS